MKYQYIIYTCSFLLAVLNSCCSLEWNESILITTEVYAGNAITTIWEDRKIKTLEHYHKSVDKSSYARGRLSYGLHNSYGKWSFWESFMETNGKVAAFKKYDKLREDDLMTLLAAIDPMNGTCPTYKNRVFGINAPKDHSPYALLVSTPYEVGEFLPRDEGEIRMKRIFYLFRNMAKRYGDVLPMVNEEDIPEEEANQP